jgi:hypothetical protein
VAAITHYDQGDVWVPQATFTVNNTPTDPTTLVVRIKAPDGTVTVITENTPATPTLPIVRASAGVFKHSGISLNDAGYWFVRFEGTGAVVATEEHEAIVDPSEFYESAQLGTRALVGLAETKDWLQQQNIDTSNDLEIARVIVDVSDRFHQEAQREFKALGTNPQTRLFAVDEIGIAYMEVNIGDATSITTVEILDNDWATVLETVSSGNYQARPLIREPWEPIRRLKLSHVNGVRWLRSDYLVRVTGSFGFPSVPGNVRQAVLDAIAAILDRDVEHYRQDLSPTVSTGESTGTVVMIGGGRQRLLSMPATSLAVAWSYRDPVIG